MADEPEHELDPEAERRARVLAELSRRVADLDATLAGKPEDVGWQYPPARYEEPPEPPVSRGTVVLLGAVVLVVAVAVVVALE